MSKAKTKSGKTKSAESRSEIVAKWLQQEAREQQARYKKIVKQMEALAPERDKWIAAFERRIQTRGFNVHSDTLRKIKPEEIYPRPKGRVKVVF